MDKQCECCLSLNNLMELTEDYANLIVSCFSIKVSTSCSFDNSSNFICGLCIRKIEESSAFRGQILISQRKLREFYLSTVANDNIKHESIVKSEPVFKEEILSDCENDDFDNSIGLNNMCVIENLNVPINQKIERNEPPIRENIFSDPLHVSNNLSIEKNKMALNRNFNFQANHQASNLKTIPISTLQQTTIFERESTSKLDSIRKSSNESFPFNMNKTTLICEVCNEFFPDHSLLLWHIGVHFPSVYVCDLCEKIFSNRKKLLQHMKSHDEPKFPCCFCQKPIKRTYMSEHIKIHAKELRFKCSQCSEEFSSRTIRLKHMGSAHNVDIYKYLCKLCPKKYYTGGGLKKHIDNCHSAKANKLTCNFCGVRFYHEVYLEVHMREHDGECHICHKKYKMKHFLVNHMATHNEEKFKCPQCDSEFARRSYLLKHVRNKHA